MIQAPCVPILSHLLLAQAAAGDGSQWIPIMQWSDIPFGLLVKFVVLPLVVLVVVWGVIHLRTRRAGANYSSPRRLFNELCALHELDWPTRKLLRQLARSRQLEHPARVFLEPDWFDLANVPPPLQAFRQELAQLKSRLF